MGVIDRWKTKLAQRRAAAAALRKKLKEADRLAKAAERVILRHENTAAKKTLQYAQAHVGVTESPPGSNTGPQINEWERAVGMIGQPWCGAFAFACLEYGGVKGLDGRMRYVPFIVEDAKAGIHGLLKIVPRAERKAGDLLIYQWDTGPVDHVGLYISTDPDGNYRTVEGNTSTSVAGSQSNGGIVANKVRSPTTVAYVIRPRY